jgi:hypothetical protein
MMLARLVCAPVNPLGVRVRPGFPTVKSFLKKHILAYDNFNEVIRRLKAYGDARLDSVLAMMARQLPLRHFN